MEQSSIGSIILYINNGCKKVYSAGSGHQIISLTGHFVNHLPPFGEMVVIKFTGRFHPIKREWGHIS
jgi:hypothetical protein